MVSVNTELGASKECDGGGVGRPKTCRRKLGRCAEPGGVSPGGTAGAVLMSITESESSILGGTGGGVRSGDMSIPKWFLSSWTVRPSMVTEIGSVEESESRLRCELATRFTKDGKVP